MERRDNLPALAERTITESEYRRLQAAEAEAAKLRDRVADLERALIVAETRETLRPDAHEEVLTRLLLTLDDFERALGAARARMDHASILEGVELVKRELERVLGLYDVTRIPVLAGDPFDPVLHALLEARDELEVSGLDIAAVERAGYLRGKKVLRRAIVRLAEADGAERGAGGCATEDGA